MSERHTIERARRLVMESGDEAYGVLLEHGTMELGYYSPDRTDPQNPHRRDEIYIVQSGSGYFVCDGVRRPFEAGEALFVPAGVLHRFEEFSDDFAAWVVFYGPEGGE